MNQNTKIALFGIGLTLSTGFAQAATYESGLLANHQWADSSWDDAKGFGASLDGVRLYNKFEGISLRISRTELEAGLAEANRDAASIGYWRYLDGDGFKLPGLRPYVNGSIGYGRFDAGLVEESGAIVEAAFGVVSTWDALIPNLKLRSELRLGWDDEADGSFLAGVGLGLHYLFGGSAKSGQTAMAPAAEPTPKPAATGDDSDGDGVRNTSDACPGTPAGTDVDVRGCVELSKFVLKGLSFATASANLVAGASPALRSAVATLKAHPAVTVEIQGHTDSQGEAARNMTLSERRAQAVKAFLVKEGINADRIMVKGFGETKPVDSNATAEGRANNRRVTFRVTSS